MSGRLLGHSVSHAPGSSMYGAGLTIVTTLLILLVSVKMNDLPLWLINGPSSGGDFSVLFLSATEYISVTDLWRAFWAAVTKLHLFLIVKSNQNELVTRPGTGQVETVVGGTPSCCPLLRPSQAQRTGCRPSRDSSEPKPKSMLSTTKSTGNF